jgi:hypothetical protein
MYKLPIEKSKGLWRKGKKTKIDDAVSVMIYDKLRMENPKPDRVRDDNSGPHKISGSTLDSYTYSLEDITSEGWSAEDIQFSFEKDKDKFLELMKNKYNKNIGDVGFAKVKGISFNADEFATDIVVDIESTIYYN